jgi:hypothetical protein
VAGLEPTEPLPQADRPSEKLVVARIGACHFTGLRIPPVYELGGGGA